MYWLGMRHGIADYYLLLSSIALHQDLRLCVEWVEGLLLASRSWRGPEFVSSGSLPRAIMLHASRSSTQGLRLCQHIMGETSRRH